VLPKTAHICFGLVDTPPARGVPDLFDIELSTMGKVSGEPSYRRGPSIPFPRDECLDIEGRGLPALLTLNQGRTQSRQLGFMLFEKPEARTQHVGRAAVTPFLHLAFDELGKVVA
jgi:hypothetical protein